MSPTPDFLLALAEKYHLDTAENLSRLVRQKSLSTQEGAMASELVAQMKTAGFDEVRTDPLGNVIGRIGHGKHILAIDAHIDTVDVGVRQNWTRDPFSGAIEDGYVYGRGTVDQKGGAAAMVTAGRILKETGFDRDWTILFTGTVMEEDCDGLCWKYLIEEEGIRPEAVVITEPTALAIYRGHRGRMEIRASFQGLSAHGSAPERGRNAIYAASRACLEIEKLHERLANDEFLGKGSVTVSEFVSGSPSLCAVADSARIHLDRRLTAGETADLALAQVRAVAPDGQVELLKYRERAYTGLEYGMDKYFPTWKLPADHPLVTGAAAAYQGLFHRPPRIDKWIFSTNAVTIAGIHGIPVVGFGPGNEVLAHAPDEKVPISDLTAAAAFYAAFAWTIELG